MRSFFMQHLWIFFSSDMGGQSMHGGGVTSLAENGVAPHIIQGIGHWASSTWQIYIHKHPVLLQAMLHAWEQPLFHAKNFFLAHTTYICLHLYLYPHSSHHTLCLALHVSHLYEPLDKNLYSLSYITCTLLLIALRCTSLIQITVTFWVAKRVVWPTSPLLHMRNQQNWMLAHQLTLHFWPKWNWH